MPFQHLRRTCWAATAFVVAALLGGCAGLPPQRSPPSIISVDAWGGSVLPLVAKPQRIRHITLHHQGETWQAGADVAAYLRRLQQWSRLTKRWVDIPYHYVIAPDGQIYAARDPAVPGDTNTEYQPEGHALVMVMGNFDEVEPSAAALQASVELMAWLAQLNGLSADTIASHRDSSAQTVCPGKKLYAYLESGWLKRAVAARMAGQSLPPP